MLLRLPVAGALALAGALPLGSFAASPSAAAPLPPPEADRQDRANERPEPPTIFDLDYEVEDPEELIPDAVEFQFRWRRIWGALGMRYHLYPAQRTGENRGPPRDFYTAGFNYSIWKNPITGWWEF